MAAFGPRRRFAAKAAVEEITQKFKQCTRCGQWVCEPVCWTHKAGLCESCAPDLDEEIAAAQAQAARDQAVEKARGVAYLGQRDLAQVASAVCPKCGAKTQGGKFCPECGAPIAAKKKCPKCGAEADGSPKFCGVRHTLRELTSAARIVHNERWAAAVTAAVAERT